MMFLFFSPTVTINSYYGISIVNKKSILVPFAEDDPRNPRSNYKRSVPTGRSYRIQYSGRTTTGANKSRFGSIG